MGPGHQRKRLAAAREPHAACLPLTAASQAHASQTSSMNCYEYSARNLECERPYTPTPDDVFRLQWMHHKQLDQVDVHHVMRAACASPSRCSCPQRMSCSSAGSVRAAAPLRAGAWSRDALATACGDGRAPAQIGKRGRVTVTASCSARAPPPRSRACAPCHKRHSEAHDGRCMPWSCLMACCLLEDGAWKLMIMRKYSNYD